MRNYTIDMQALKVLPIKSTLGSYNQLIFLKVGSKYEVVENVTIFGRFTNRKIRNTNIAKNLKKIWWKNDFFRESSSM